MPFVIVAWLTWFLCWSHWTDLFWLQNLLPMATGQSCASNCSAFCTYTHSESMSCLYPCCQVDWLFMVVSYSCFWINTRRKRKRKIIIIKRSWKKSFVQQWLGWGYSPRTANTALSSITYTCTLQMIYTTYVRWTYDWGLLSEDCWGWVLAFCEKWTMTSIPKSVWEGNFPSVDETTLCSEKVPAQGAN